MVRLIDRFYRTAKQDYREYGIQGIGVTLSKTADHLKRQAAAKLAERDAQNVYERPWDVLVLLDCTRVDMMEQVNGEFDFISDIGTHTSLGTTSREWMEKTFTDEYRTEMADTLHVTANTASDAALDADDFLHLEEVWRDGWDDTHKTILPETVTDRAIALHRQLRSDRTIIHYMQPHPPFVPSPDVAAAAVGGDKIDDYGKTVEELAADGYTREELWELHMENLRYVLDSVELLLSNMEAERVVLSSDHGQALGEDGVWGHPYNSPLDCLREVPWCVTSASDSGNYIPNYHPADSDPEDSELSVNQKLRYLGYKPEG